MTCDLSMLHELGACGCGGNPSTPGDDTQNRLVFDASDRSSYPRSIDVTLSTITRLNALPPDIPCLVEWWDERNVPEPSHYITSTGGVIVRADNYGTAGYMRGARRVLLLGPPVPRRVTPRCPDCRVGYPCWRHRGPMRAPDTQPTIIARDADPGFVALVQRMIGARVETPTTPAMPALNDLRASARLGAFGRAAAPVAATPATTAAEAPEGAEALAERRRAEAKASRIELARRKLSWFVRGAFREVLKPGEKLEWAWYLDAICDHVQAQLEGWMVANGHFPETLPGLREREDARWTAHDLQRAEGELLVQNGVYNISPGTLKSIIIMVCAPAWMWLHVPTFQWGATSGAPGNVTRDSDAHRDIVRSAWYRDSFEIKWEVRGDIDAKELWTTTAGGSRTSRGMVAKWIGVHVDGLLCDDPDDAHGVFGEAQRRDTQGKWKALGNRVNSLERSIRMIVQQVVHSECLSLTLLAAGAWSPQARSNWAKLEIAMEFDPARRHTSWLLWTDPRNEVGEVMHPARFTRRVLDAERLRLGNFGYQAQYNQAPENVDGGMFTRAYFRFFLPEGAPTPLRERPPECVPRDTHPAYIVERDKRGQLKLDTLVLSVDATFGSTKTTASNVGLLAAGCQGARRLIFGDRTKAMTYLDTEAAIVEMIIEYRPERVLIEKKANGAAIIEAIEKKIADGDIVDADGKAIITTLEAIEPKNDGGSKEGRAAAAMPTFDAGLVMLLDGAAWCDDLVSEVCAFPNGKRDDRVDALTQFLNFFAEAVSMEDRWQALAAL